MCFISFIRGRQEDAGDGRKDAEVRIGDCFLIVDWGSKTQSVCADSTPAAEAIGIHYGVRHALTLEEAVNAIVIGERADASSSAYVCAANDNQSALAAYRRGFSEKLGHYQKAAGLKLRFVRDMINTGVVQLGHVKTTEDLADIGTKVFERLKFQEMRSKIGVGNIENQGYKNPEVDDTDDIRVEMNTAEEDREATEASGCSKQSGSLSQQPCQ